MKKKRKNNGKLILVLLILGLTVGFALLTATLSINGIGKINKAHWIIHWENVQVKEGSVSTTNPATIVDEKRTIVEYSAVLAKPGDFYEFTVDAKNDGDIDAMVTAIDNKLLDENDQEIDPLPDYLTYTVTYYDGKPVEINNLLKAGRSEKYKVVVKFKSTITEDQLPEEDQEYKFRFSVTYGQSDENGSIREGICDASIYDENDVTESRYLDLCESYIDEDIYTYTVDGNNATITGFKDGYTIQQVKSGVRDLKASKLLNDREIKATKVDDKVISFKDGVWAIPLTIGGKKVTKISGDAFSDKGIDAELVFPPTLIEIEDGSSSPSVVGAFYKNSITAIGMPYRITKIGDYAFAYNKLTKAEIRDSVTTLGATSYYEMPTLKKVKLGSGIDRVGVGAFAHDGITKLTVPGNVKTVAGGAFSGNPIVELVLEEGIVETQGGSFSDMPTKKIVIPNSITTIQTGSFNGTQVEELIIGDGVTQLGYGDFTYTNLKKLVVGNGMNKIGAIGNVPKLVELDLGNSVKTITDGSFYRCKLKKVEIPDSVTTLANGSFSGCDVLEEVDFGDGVTYLGTGIFGSQGENIDGQWVYYNAVENLKKVRFGNSVQTISDGLLTGALKLEEIDWGNGNNQITIQSGAMNSLGIERLVLPDNVIAVTSGALCGTKAKYIDTGNGLKVIQSGTFSGNSSLETLIIGDSVEEIQSAPFYSIPTLTNVTFGSNLKTISAGVFQNSGLTSVDLSNSKVETIGNMAFINNNISSVDLGDHIVTIGPEAFSTNNITSVVFPSTTRTIGDLSFAYNNISSITVPEGVTYLSGFRENNISELTIPSTVTELGRDAFNDNNISSVTLPNGLITIGALSLGKNNLTSITIPNTVTTIGDAAFYANKLTDYTIPSSVLNIGGGVFVGNQITDPNKMFTYIMNDGVYDYTTLASYNGRGGTVTIPSGVTKLANFAFFNTYITGIQGVENITEFGEHTFSWTELESFTIPNAVTTIPHSLFYGAKLKHVTLHNNIDTISHSAFLRTDLEEVTIPDSVTTIGYDAFRDTKLTTVTIPASVTRIESNAFSGCNLSTVYFYPSSTSTLMGYPTFYKGRKRDKERYDYANSNPNLTEIHNIGGMQHYWGKIVAGDSAPWNSITSGTLTTDLGDISLTTN